MPVGMRHYQWLSLSLAKAYTLTTTVLWQPEQSQQLASKSKAQVGLLLFFLPSALKKTKIDLKSTENFLMIRESQENEKWKD